MSVMKSQLPRSRWLLLPEASPVQLQGPRPKVRRYSLVRLQVDPLTAVGSSGFEQQGCGRSAGFPRSYEEG
jgi:hypothetical protein